ncbi:MAG TPA: penicillin-binding transpeptidase domain-containing protein, partial [Candidatus Nanopelagicales bacterium]|nr:penicillin-binding transpeptidase domain-containing protein [Candidatus Nanopelagicales bacterium]
GKILDRDGRTLASSRRTENGMPYRVYADPAVSHPVGYTSALYGSAGLERTFTAELTGGRDGDPLSRILAKFLPPEDRRSDLQTALSLPLQRLAVRLLGDNRGAVVMLDPRSGEVLVLASTPVFDASGIADPATATATFTALRDDGASPLLDRAVLGRYVPGSAFKIVTAIAGLGSGSISRGTTFPEQPGSEEDGLLVSGYRVRDGHHPFTGMTALDLVEATEVSCNIWYALAGLQAGGANLDAFARRLGFGSALPFDLPTAPSQLTNGGGPLPGGFQDDVELANAAYGQGEVLTTPLQMALVAAAVANGGELMEPRLVTALIDREGGRTTISPRSMGRILDQSANAVLVEAMTRAVEGTYGQLFTEGARVPGILTAGKSGTAEIGGKGEPHSWFIGFAPADAPTVAIAVVVEKGGRGGARAAPLAGQMLRAYFEAQP